MWLCHPGFRSTCLSSDLGKRRLSPIPGRQPDHQCKLRSKTSCTPTITMTQHRRHKKRNIHIVYKTLINTAPKYGTAGHKRLPPLNLQLVRIKRLACKNFAMYERGQVLELVSHNGIALKFASEELRRDRQVVLAAVKSYGAALQFASDELRRDREIVLTAVSSTGYAPQALEFAAEDLRSDEEIVSEALAKNVASFPYMSGSLLQNMDFA
eukprot:5364668-Amphidinium_carterae.1